MSTRKISSSPSPRVILDMGHPGPRSALLTFLNDPSAHSSHYQPPMYYVYKLALPPYASLSHVEPASLTRDGFAAR